MAATMADLTGALNGLRLTNDQLGRALELHGAIVGPPALSLTIDGASTLTINVADHKRKLTQSPTLDTRSWAVVDLLTGAVHFELVGIAKTGDQVALTFEDAIAAALRRQTSPRTFKAGHWTRRGIGVALCDEARVPYLIDPTHAGMVHTAITRSSDGQKSTSWDVLGSDVASPINWRRFSNGQRLVMGGDDWLTSTLKPTELKENTGGVQFIDFDLDNAKLSSKATVYFDARVAAFVPGHPISLSQLGPADGLWLVETISQLLGSPRGSMTLVRKTHVLKEPKRQAGSTQTARDKDSGDPSYIPGQTGTDPGGKAATAQREKMVQYALAQQGKPYVWGQSGPGSFDCSGLVQAATTAAGKPLAKPSESQLTTCRNAGKTISVDEARHTRGALMFIMTSADHHVAISLGDGVHTVQAKGTGYGCGVFTDAAWSGWTDAALWI
jgi:cell wall-associated NlpC family hydrolase